MTPTSTVTPHRVNSSIVASASAMILHKDNNSTMAPTDTATPHKDNNTATLHKDNDNVAPANRVSGSSVLNTTTASLDARSIDTGTPHRNNDIKSNAVAPTSTNVNNFASATARNTPFHTLITDPARKSNNNASTTQNIPNSVDVSTLAVNDRATLRIFIMKKALFAATSEDHTFTTPDGVIRDFNPDMSLDRIEKLVEEESEVDEAVLKAMGHGGVRGK
ncbi:hypothetical protein BGW39_006533 [Mortierella sp. 14UC]|nr:hypothetical protein BGW39_006533 [Mortierella sp. 14UC]